MGDVIIRVVITVLIVISLDLLLAIILRTKDDAKIKNSSEEHIVIRLPKAYLWIGLICFAFFAMFFTFAITSGQENSYWVCPSFALFALMGLFIAVETKIWKIEIFRNYDFFIYRTAFLRTYKIFYSDCKGFKLNDNYLTLKTHNKTFLIDRHSMDSEFFQEMLSRYKIKEENSTKEHIVIRLPNANLFGGLICFVVFTICFIFTISYWQKDSYWASPLFAFMALTGLLLAIETRIWKIEVFRNDDFFIYRTVFFKTYKIFYSDCNILKRSNIYLTLKVHNKTFFIDTKSKNFKFFHSMLSKHKVK